MRARASIERRQLLDPEDRGVAIALLTERARIEGPAVYLDALADRRLWKSCPEPIQDQAIAAAGQILGGAFRHTETRVYACGGQEHRIAGFEHRASRLAFQLIPGGVFTLGSETGRREERPARVVKIRRPFLLGQTPVTQGQWRGVTGRGVRVHADRARRDNFFARCLYYGVGAERPMYYVTWQEADRFARDLGLRLPGEAEWEYAARAGTSTRYFWGDRWEARFSWTHENSREACRPVTAHADASNAFGLVDMAGNIHEFCQDVYIAQYRSGPKDERPRLKGRSAKRVIRGGSAANRATQARSAYRTGLDAQARSFTAGLRLACSLPV